MSFTRFAARVPKKSKAVHVAPGRNQISLGGGYAFPALLPDISDIAAEVARDFRVGALQYGPLMGLPDLRDEIVRFLAADGVTTTRENILIVNGAKHGIDLALRLFVEPGDLIVVTKPNYATALHIFRNHEAKFLEITMDQDGPDVDGLERLLEDRRRRSLAMPKITYVVPDFHNPTGVTMSAARRRRLVELAETFDFMVIEDDPYRHINFSGNFAPPIKSFDRGGRVISVGTVSKIFAPGIRVGWACTTPEIVDLMAMMKSDGGCSPFTQRIVSLMMKSGRVAEHARQLSGELKIHRDVMVAALRRHLPDAKFAVPQGGYYIWIELDGGVNADELAAASERSGVTIFSGTPYFSERRPNNFIRLCYSNSTPVEIERGVEILGDVARRIANEPRAEAGAAAVAQHTD